MDCFAVLAMTKNGLLIDELDPAIPFWNADA
jgi:hypothetical protein